MEDGAVGGDGVAVEELVDEVLLLPHRGHHLRGQGQDGAGRHTGHGGKTGDLDKALFQSLGHMAGMAGALTTGWLVPFDTL